MILFSEILGVQEILEEGHYLEVLRYIVNSPWKKRFYNFSPRQGPKFLDFIDNRLLNYIPSGFRICFPLFWRIFFRLGSNLMAPLSSDQVGIAMKTWKEFNSSFSQLF